METEASPVLCIDPPNVSRIKITKAIMLSVKSDSRKIENAKAFKNETRQHSHKDHAHKNRDPVAETRNRKERESDNCRRIDAERFDSDNLAKKRN